MTIKPEFTDLVNAAAAGALAAIHIDLQTSFYAEVARSHEWPTAKAFPAVNDFAAKLRELEVENYWVAFLASKGWSKELCSEFMSEVVEGTHQTLHSQIRVHPDEYIFYKADKCAMPSKTSPLSQHLNDAGQKTIIIDGVKAKACLTDTLVAALDQDFRIYVTLDSTDCPEIDFSTFPKWFLIGLSDEQKSRITFTTTKEVIGVLENRKAASRPEPVAAYG